MTSQYLSNTAGGVRSEYISGAPVPPPITASTAPKVVQPAVAPPVTSPTPVAPAGVSPTPTPPVVATPTPVAPGAPAVAATGGNSAMSSTLSSSGIGGPVSARSSHFDILGDIAAGRFGHKATDAEYFGCKEGQNKLLPK